MSLLVTPRFSTLQATKVVAMSLLLTGFVLFFVTPLHAKLWLPLGAFAGGHLLWAWVALEQSKKPELWVSLCLLFIDGLAVGWLA